MKSKELRDKFLKYFEERGHQIVSSASLIPADESVLLTTAGMQQFVPYLSGEKDVLDTFEKKHLCSSQKCFRTVDIENIGDDTHHTFFEMLGNWSIGTENGEYFKKGAIKFALDFFVNELGLDKEKIHVTVFKGEGEIGKDTEAIDLWKENGIPDERIREFGSEDNFWGPTAETGPCGPCSEIHYDRGEEYGKNCPGPCGPNCEECLRYVEIWNLVFMEYNKKEDGSFEKLAQTNIDTGIGFERLLSLLNKSDSAYESDLFEKIIEKIDLEDQKAIRIIADHMRGSVFLIADGILPSNTSKGYILRRLLRRSIRFGKSVNLIEVAKVVMEEYKDVYPEVGNEKIIEVIKEEQEKFEKTLEKGLKEFSKLERISGDDAFNLYQSYGFPLELTQELAEEKGIEIDKKGFEEALEKHQEVSRKGMDKKFKGGLADTSEQTTKYHTATHLLLAALKKVLNKDVEQRGSNINSERARFDFSHDAKLTEEEVQQVEDLINEKIKEGIEVTKEEMSLEQARKEGASGIFGEKYGETVSVYTIGDFSKEICGGPHVKNTSELGEFKIKKQESPGAGARRIKAILK